ERGGREPGAVQRVDAPSPRPAAIGMLGAAQELGAAADAPQPESEAVLGGDRQNAPGGVGAGRVGDALEVGEGNGVEEAGLVVDVERRPAAVASLHAERPV